MRAARGAGAEVRQGLHAGGGGLGRRRAAHAALRAAARRRARALPGAGRAAARHLPPLQPRQGLPPQALTGPSPAVLASTCYHLNVTLLFEASVGNVHFEPFDGTCFMTSEKEVNVNTINENEVK